MKRLLLVLFILVGVSSAFAADLKVTGDFMVRGNMDSNFALDTSNERTNDYFDYDLNLNLALIANESATVFVKLTYDKNVDEKGTVANGDATDYDRGTASAQQTYKNSSLAVERAYLNYKFAPFLQAEAGLMAGGQWASTFGDTEINVMRLKVIGALSPDLIFLAIYQKDNELNSGTSTESVDPADSEKDDVNTYYLAGSLTFGPLKVLPLLIYNTAGVNYDGALNQASLGNITKKYDVTTMAFDLGINGDFGMIGFESEFIYKKTDTDGFADDNAAAALYLLTAADKDLYDRTTYGAYVNVFAKIDPFKVGFVYAYASSDKTDGTFSWGEDFDVCVVMDDWIFNSQDGLTAENLKGFSVYKLYAEAKIDKLTVNAAVAYGASNISDDDSEFTEIDAGVAYALDANATYSIYGGYAMTDKFDGLTESVNAYTIRHQMAIKF
jgi:hypothetical protein